MCIRDSRDRAQCGRTARGVARDRGGRVRTRTPVRAHRPERCDRLDAGARRTGRSPSWAARAGWVRPRWRSRWLPQPGCRPGWWSAALRWRPASQPQRMPNWRPRVLRAAAVVAMSCWSAPSPATRPCRFRPSHRSSGRSWTPTGRPCQAQAPGGWGQCCARSPTSSSSRTPQSPGSAGLSRAPNSSAGTRSGWSWGPRPSGGRVRSRSPRPGCPHACTSPTAPWTPAPG